MTITTERWKGGGIAAPFVLMPVISNKDAKVNGLDDVWEEFFPSEVIGPEDVPQRILDRALLDKRNHNPNRTLSNYMSLAFDADRSQYLATMDCLGDWQRKYPELNLTEDHLIVNIRTVPGGKIARTYFRKST